MVKMVSVAHVGDKVQPEKTVRTAHLAILLKKTNDAMDHTYDMTYILYAEKIVRILDALPSHMAVTTS